MCTQSAARRRRSQAKKNFTHLALRGRPLYKKPGLLGIHAAIERERIRAAREARAKSKKK